MVDILRIIGDVVEVWKAGEKFSTILISTLIDLLFELLLEQWTEVGIMLGEEILTEQSLEDVLGM